MPVVQVSNNEALWNEFAQLSSGNSVSESRTNLGSDSLSEVTGNRGDIFNEVTANKGSLPSNISFSTLDDCASVCYSVANTIVTNNELVIIEESASSQCDYEALRIKYQSALENNKIFSSRLVKSQQIISSLKEKISILSREVSTLQTEKENLQKSNENLLHATEMLNKQFEEYKDRESSICWRRMQYRLECRDKFATCDLSLPIYNESNKQPLREFMESSKKVKKTTDVVATYSERPLDHLVLCPVKPQNLAVEINKNASDRETSDIKTANNDSSCNANSLSSVESDDANNKREQTKSDDCEMLLSKDNNLTLTDSDNRPMTPIIEESIISVSCCEEKEQNKQESFSIQANTRQSSAGFQVLSLSDAETDQVQSIQTNTSQRSLNGLYSRWAQKAEARAKRRASQKAAAKANHPAIKMALSDDESTNARSLLKLLPMLPRRDKLDTQGDDTTYSSETTGNNLTENSTNDNHDAALRVESNEKKNAPTAAA